MSYQHPYPTNNPAMRLMRRLIVISGWLLASFATGSDGTALPSASAGDPDAEATVPVTVPLRLDYPLLEELLARQLFTGTGASRELLDDPSGCSSIILSSPAVSSMDQRLVVVGDVQARIGIGNPGSCMTMLTWQGRLAVSGSPEVRSDGTALGFTTDEVWLEDAAGARVTNGTLQSLAETSVLAVLNDFEVDLQPQLQSVGRFLPEVLPRYSREQIQALIETLKVSRLQVAEKTLNADMTLSITPLSEPLKPERALTDAELALWEERWQLMDSLLVLAVKHYAAATELQDLRDALLDALIESRYRLRDALTEPPGTGSDTVREWFLASWQNLAPTLRRIGSEQSGQEHLLLLSVVAATDALDALDQLGPGVGLDISTDGLRRLARMINEDGGEELLEYSEDVDPQLRKLFEDSLNATPPPTAWRWRFSLFPEAVASNTGRLNSWAPQRKDLPQYLPLVGSVLNETATDTAERRRLDKAYGELFRRLVLTTAWQESCWRHYTVSDDRKLVPVRSGTGDVGLMQINERVWRGFYDRQQLRWDINYNIEAGAEVLIDYLLKYAIRKGEHRQPGGITNLARASYSAYNGGPSRLSRYRSADAPAYGKKVDGLFWEKYQQVAAGNELAVSACLGGNMSGPVARYSPASSASSKADGFALQLGVFSSSQSAENFIRQQSLGDAARVKLRGDRNTGQYLVLYGSYATRQQAQSAQRALTGLDAWIRPLSDL